MQKRSNAGRQTGAKASQRGKNIAVSAEFVVVVAANVAAVDYVVFGSVVVDSTFVE